MKFFVFLIKIFIFSPNFIFCGFIGLERKIITFWKMVKKIFFLTNLTKFLTNILTNFDFSVDFSLTYNLLTVVSFRIRVPLILFLYKFSVHKTQKLCSKISSYSSKTITNNGELSRSHLTKLEICIKVKGTIPWF